MIEFNEDGPISIPRYCFISDSHHMFSRATSFNIELSVDFDVLTAATEKYLNKTDSRSKAANVYHSKRDRPKETWEDLHQEYLAIAAREESWVRANKRRRIG